MSTYFGLSKIDSVPKSVVELLANAGFIFARVGMMCESSYRWAFCCPFCTSQSLILTLPRSRRNDHLPDFVPKTTQCRKSKIELVQSNETTKQMMEKTYKKIPRLIMRPPLRQRVVQRRRPRVVRRRRMAMTMLVRRGWHRRGRRVPTASVRSSRHS